MVSASTSTVIVWASSGPVVTVVYVPNEPDANLDCEFSLVLEDAPRDEPLPSTPHALVHLECAMDEWPGIGRGLDLARAHREAELVGGEWRAKHD
jgi:hypothetical protein